MTCDAKEWRILFTGGRDFKDEAEVERVVRAIANMQPLVVIHGGCRGADMLVDKWARKLGLTVEVFHAKWTEYGHKAGPIRNQAMVDSGVDIFVALPGDKGTRDCIRRCIKAGAVPFEKTHAELFDILAAGDRAR